MKKIYSLLLAGSLVFGVSTIANAQPPDTQASTISQKYSLPPAATISTFLSACSFNSLEWAATFVEGADGDDPSLQIVKNEMAGAFDHFNLNARDIKITPDPANPDIVTAAYTLILNDPVLGYGTITRESVTLQKVDSRKETIWKILPYDLDKQSLPPFGAPSSNGQINFSNDAIRRLATLIAYPQKALPGIYLQQSMGQLKQLGLALLMFTQDYNERLDFDQQNFRKKLTPYLKNDLVFTAPSDSAGTTSYDVNANIVGLSLADFTSPSETVAFYMGHDQKLDFRYGGLSPVCFMDGHVRAMTPDGAKHLRWEP